MADTRDKDLTRTTAPASDDVARLDGATNGTRGILVTDLLSPLYARVLLGDVGRANQDALYFDGATAGARLYAAMGAAGAVTTLPFTILTAVAVPTVNGATSRGLVALSNSNSAPSTAAYALTTEMRTGGDLWVNICGATSSDFNRITVTGFRSTYSGVDVELAIVRPAAGNALLFANGQLVAGTYSTGGTPPTWQGNVISTYLTFGVMAATEMWQGRATPPVLVLGELSAVEILTRAQTGRLPTWCEIATGSVIPQYASDFSSVNGWTAANSGTAAVSGSRLQITTVASPTNSGATRANVANKTGARYRIDITAKVSSGTITTYNFMDSSAQLGLVDVTTGLAPEFLPTASDATYTLIVVRRSGSSVFIHSAVGANAVLDISSIVVTPIAPIAKWVVQPCMACDDRGDNGIPLVLTSGVKPITSRKDWRIRPFVDMSTTGNKQLLGAAFTENPLAHAFDSIEPTHGANGATYSVGDGATATAYTASAAQMTGRKRLTITNPFPADAAKTGIYANVTVAGASETAVPVVICGHRTD